MSTEILVIDDDPRITSLLQRALRFAGHAVRGAGDGAKGLVMAAEHPPDLVILDVMLPGMDGLAVCRRLRLLGDVPILMLTARDDIPDRVLGLDAGADDYLVKPFAVEELLARVRALLRRAVDLEDDEPDPPGTMEFSDLVLDTGARCVRRGGRATPLSTTEYKLLRLLLRHPDQVLTRVQLMDRVWGLDYLGESNVLEVYIRYLRIKLEQDGLPRLIHTVRGTGYVLRE
ncbi:MAG TPA: response regulator transcription factor [Chloroflexota bacterium]|nr:response regulator transcription factor [Chloroflexota bacterium]